MTRRGVYAAALVVAAAADVVCFQECSEQSVAADFGFMAALGYAPPALLAKGRMRSATVAHACSPYSWTSAASAHSRSAGRGLAT
mgnify:CR=1 FL=1